MATSGSGSLKRRHSYDADSDAGSTATVPLSSEYDSALDMLSSPTTESTSSTQVSSSSVGFTYIKQEDLYNKFIRAAVEHFQQNKREWDKVPDGLKTLAYKKLEMLAQPLHSSKLHSPSFWDKNLRLLQFVELSQLRVQQTQRCLDLIKLKPAFDFLKNRVLSKIGVMRILSIGGGPCSDAIAAVLFAVENAEARVVRALIYDYQAEWKQHVDDLNNFLLRQFGDNRIKFEFKQSDITGTPTKTIPARSHAG